MGKRSEIFTDCSISLELQFLPLRLSFLPSNKSCHSKHIVHRNLNSKYFEVLSEQKYFVSGDRQLSFIRFAKMQRYQRGRSIVTKILISGFDMPVTVSNGKKIEDWKGGVQAALHRNSKRFQTLAMENWRRQGHEIADDFFQDPMASHDLLLTSTASAASTASAEELFANTEEPTFELFGETGVSLLWAELFLTVDQFGFPQDDAFPFDRFT
jgi:hypothetical protein